MQCGQRNQASSQPATSDSTAALTTYCTVYYKYQCTLPILVLGLYLSFTTQTLLLWEKPVARLRPVLECVHLHLHLRIVSAVALVIVLVFALGACRFAYVCRFPLRLHLCCVCVYTCIALTFALVLPCCSLCTGVALGLHLSLCFVPSALWKETLRNLHLLWHLLAGACVGVCCWLPSLVVALALQL